MRIGFIATRLKGTDGVSLEVGKWSKVLRRMGHELYYCAGELGGYAKEGTLIQKLHFAHQFSSSGSALLMRTQIWIVKKYATRFMLLLTKFAILFAGSSVQTT